MSTLTPKAALIGRAVLALLAATPILASAASAARFQTSRALVTVFLTMALLAMLIAAVTRSWRRFFLACFPFVILSSAFAGYEAFFGGPPGRTAALVVASASPEEIMGFLSLSQVTIPALGLLTASILYLVLAIRQPNQPMFAAPSSKSSGRPVGGSRLLLLLCVPFTVYSAANSTDLIDGIGNNPVIGSVMFLAGEIPRARHDMAGGQVHQTPYQATRAGAEEVHILVIGESARRASWSAYGYRRPTTPYLVRIKDEVILLRDAVADANLTSWSVPIMLTGVTPEALPNTEFRGNLLDLAKEAGYGTTWLLNQDINISRYVGIHADHTTYLPEMSRNIFGRDTLDETLLPAFRAAIDSTGAARFIGLHIMGSHWIYSHRYPSSFHPLGNMNAVKGVTLFDSRRSAREEVVDTYDNTIAYTDWFLQQLIEKARTLQTPATLTYFPDHGEDLAMYDGQTGHGSSRYTPHNFEVPAFVWVNEAYRRAHPQKVSALVANASKEIRTHDVFATVADLMGITWPTASPLRSFASEQFVPDAAMKHIAGGQLVSRQVPQLNAQDLSAQR